MPVRLSKPVLVAATSLVLAALAAAGCSSAGHRHSSATTVPIAPTTTSAALATTTEAAPDLASEPYAWARQGGTSLSIGGGATASLSAVLGPDVSPTWLIAGTRVSANGLPAATVWTSADATGWRASALAIPTSASQAEAAAQWHGATVIGGAVGEGSTQHAAVWFSPAGRSHFTGVPVPTSAGPSSISAVAQGALGLFAVGTVDGKLAFWSSTNGVQWTESAQAERVIGASQTSRVNSLLAEGDIVYAAGTTSAGASTEAALWSSGDGINWHQVTSAPTSFTGSGSRAIEALAPLGTGLVAVGAVSRGGRWFPASWISPNGASWSQPSEAFAAGTRPLEAPLSGDAMIRDVSAITTLSGPNELVAVGGSATQQRVWTSSDGSHWTALALPPGAAASTAWQASLVASSIGTTVVVDGVIGQPHVLTSSPVGWKEPSTDPATFGSVQPQPVPVALSENGTGLVLEVQVTTPTQTIKGSSSAVRFFTSSDGRSWTAGHTAQLSDRPAALPAGAVTATRFRSGWVAVGRGPSGAASWTSTNGISWKADGALDPAPTTPSVVTAKVVKDPEAICAAPETSQSTAEGLSRLAAVGSDRLAGGGTGGVAWESGDGIHWQQDAVTPAPIAAGREEMLGCFDTTTGFVGFGGTTGAGGDPTPALWKSGSGSTWSRQPASGFSPYAAGPITALARNDSTWLALAGSNADAGRGGLPGYAAPGIWLSSDRGSLWQALDTIGSPWDGIETARIDLAAFAGGVPVVVGTLDGRLAVWSGALVSDVLSTTTTTP